MDGPREVKSDVQALCVIPRISRNRDQIRAEYHDAISSTMASIAPNPDDNNTCWVCLNGAGDKSSPLLRDCACHGSSGFAHLKCLSRSAINHTESFLHSKNEKPSGGSNRHSGGSNRHSSVGSHFGPRGCNPWSECPLCKYPYEGETLQALACAIQQRYGKDLSIISDNESSQSLSKDRGEKSPFPIYFQKFDLSTISNAKAKSSKRTCKEEAIRLYQQVLEIERSEQESFAGRRCTALEKRIVSEEMVAMCCMGEIYADLGQCQNALAILEGALALTERRDCRDEEASDGRAHALRIMSEVMLSNGNLDGAERCLRIFGTLEANRVPSAMVSNTSSICGRVESSCWRLAIETSVPVL